MKRSSEMVIRAFAVAAFAIAIVGCMPVKSDHPYSPGTDEAIQVPSGARIIASGQYPIGPFMIPHEAGNVYLWDETIDRVVSITRPQASSELTDLSQLSKSSLDQSHHYRVYFVPDPLATTQPVANP